MDLLSHWARAILPREAQARKGMKKRKLRAISEHVPDSRAWTMSMEWTGRKDIVCFFPSPLPLCPFFRKMLRGREKLKTWGQAGDAAPWGGSGHGEEEGVPWGRGPEPSSPIKPCDLGHKSSEVPVFCFHLYRMRKIMPYGIAVGFIFIISQYP